MQGLTIKACSGIALLTICGIEVVEGVWALILIHLVQHVPADDCVGKAQVSMLLNYSRALTLFRDGSSRHK